MGLDWRALISIAISLHQDVVHRGALVPVIILHAVVQRGRLMCCNVRRVHKTFKPVMSHKRVITVITSAAEVLRGRHRSLCAYDLVKRLNAACPRVRSYRVLELQELHINVQF
jgi:hypothetical protein